MIAKKRIFATSRIGDPAENRLRERGYELEVFQGPEAPPKKPDVEKLWAELGADAKKLETAARAIVPLSGAEREKKQKEIDDIILRISRNVRTLRALN